MKIALSHTAAPVVKAYLMFCEISNITTSQLGMLINSKEPIEYSFPLLELAIMTAVWIAGFPQNGIYIRHSL